jgi:hypothetical protein
LPQCLHTISGSVYNVGAVSEASSDCACDRKSLAAGSVVDLGNVGAVAVGGVPWVEAGLCRPLAGSVVRRKVGGWKGVMAGVEMGGAGVPTIAKELVGLSLVGTLKPRPRGEFGDVLVCRLMRNCCLASSPPRWP